MSSEDKFHFQQRSRIDIIACILENSNRGARKTKLIYKCNLSFSQFNLYKNCLVKAGLINVLTQNDGIEIFETTEKGKEFLKDYRRIKDVLDKMRL
ncbi:MAG: winged helix-turn-helix domain-containing protein [Candidatus Bathyarchaeia archaeon]